MSSRETILKAIRANKPAATLHPGAFIPSVVADPQALFAERIQLAGGEALVFPPDFQADWIVSLFAENQRVLSFVDQVASTIPMPESDRGFADIDLVVMAGQLAVAENGAVWVDFSNADQRRASLLAQHVALIVPLGHLVPTMHDVMSHAAFLQTPKHQGVFLSGPSKTADIEQCLVIGAHGACSLRVIFC